MAGYNHRKGMSNNAVSAYSEGKMPKSKITKQKLIEAGIYEPLCRVKKAIDERLLTTKEWHHSGGDWFNKVDFYDLNDLKIQIEELGGLTQYYKKKPQPKSADKIVKGYYSEWNGSRRRPRIVDEVAFVGTLKSNGWIYLQDGSRKKASGKWINYEVIGSSN